REGRDQGGGQVVDAEVAQVLEALDRVALARPREAGDDDEADGLGGDGIGHARLGRVARRGRRLIVSRTYRRSETTARSTATARSAAVSRLRKARARERRVRAAVRRCF